MTYHRARLNISAKAQEVYPLKEMVEKEKQSDIEGIRKIEESPANTSYNKFVYKERFLVEQGKRIFILPVQNVAYFYSDQRLVFLVTTSNQKYTTSYKVEELEQLLNPDQFFRVNRSHIVSILSVDQIMSLTGNRFKLKLIPPASEEVFISRNRWKEFKKWLGG